METETSSRWNYSTGDGIALASVVVGVALAVGQCYSSYSATQAQAKQNTVQIEMQTRQNLVQIAVGVLSQKAPRDKEGKIQEFPEDEQALRKWSVALLNKNSPNAKIEGKAETALIKGKSSLVYGGVNYQTGDYYSFGDENDHAQRDGQPSSRKPTSPTSPAKAD